MGCTLGKVGLAKTANFRDDFERADRTLDDNGWTPAGIYPIGSSTLTSTRFLQIVSGRATLAVTGAGYAIRRVPNLRKITVSVRWATGSTDGSYVGVVSSAREIAENNITEIGVNSVHCAVGRTARLLGLYDNAISAAVDTDLYTIATGTDVTFSIEWDGANTVTITDPDGGTETYTSGLVGKLWGDTIYIEVLNTDASTDRIASINWVTVEGDETVTLQSPNTIKRNGDTLRVGGEFAVAEADGRVLAAQLMGYGVHNTDEPVVPFTYDAEAVNEDLDGMYAIADVDLDYVKLAAGLFSWSAELVAVPGAQAPILELTRMGDLRDNDNSVTDNVAVSALPGGFRTPRFSEAQDAEESVPVEGGSVRLFSSDEHDMSVTYALPPGSFYEGACTVEVSYDGGGTWSLVVGRQVKNLPGFVRVGNGRVRVTVSLSGGTSLLSTEVWDSTLGQWERCDFNVTDSGSPTTVSTYTHPFIQGPQGIASGPDGNLWFVGGNTKRIWKVTPGGALTSYLVTGVDSPYGIASGPDGNLWFTSAANDKIGKSTTAGVAVVYTNANLDSPYGIASGPDGNLWVASTGNDSIVKVTTASPPVFTAYTDANIDGPTDICSDGTDLWFTSNENDKIGKITTAGVVTMFTTGVGNAPNHICFGPDGLLWFTRTDDDAICKMTTAGVVTTYTAGVPNAPTDICSDGTDLWFTYQNGIGKITTAGAVTLKTHANIDDPRGIVKGPDGNLWFTSKDNNRVGVLNPSTGVTGPVEFGGTLTVLRNSPETVAIRLGAADGPEMLDLAIRRGMNFVEGYMQSTTSSTYGISRTESETGANIGTYGIKANAINAYGNQFTLLSPQDITQDTTGVSGLVLAAGATTFAFAMSPVNTDTLSTDAPIDDAYFAAIHERQQTAAR